MRRGHTTVDNRTARTATCRRRVGGVSPPLSSPAASPINLQIAELLEGQCHRRERAQRPDARKRFGCEITRRAMSFHRYGCVWFLRVGELRERHAATWQRRTTTPQPARETCHPSSRASATPPPPARHLASAVPALLDDLSARPPSLPRSTARRPASAHPRLPAPRFGYSCSAPLIEQQPASRHRKGKTGRPGPRPCDSGSVLTTTGNRTAAQAAVARARRSGRGTRPRRGKFVNPQLVRGGQ